MHTKLAVTLQQLQQAQAQTLLQTAELTTVCDGLRVEKKRLNTIGLKFKAEKETALLEKAVCGTNIPSYPGSNIPSYPGSNIPSYPGSNIPSYPGFDIPSYPDSNIPSYPGSNIPSYPRL